LEKTAFEADQQRELLGRQKVSALPGQREQIVSQIKEFESMSTANKAMARLLKNENPYALATREAEIALMEDPEQQRAGTESLQDLRMQRDKDLQVVQTEQVRLARREAILQAQMPAAERKEEQERQMRAAHQSVDMAVAKGTPLAQAIRDAGNQFQVEKADLAKNVLAARGAGVWQAQIEFARLPTERQTTQQAGKIADRYGVSPKDVLEGAKLPNRPGVEVNINSPSERKDIAEERSQLDMLSRIAELYNPGFVGPADSRLGYLKSATGTIKQQEAEFRSAVTLMRAQLRKFYFGTAQSKQELQGSLEAIPDLTMTDPQFEASLRQTRENVRSILARRGEVMEQSGVRAPKGKSFSDRYDELHASGKDKAAIFQQMQREGY
jgi:hypothetical protein